MRRYLLILFVAAYASAGAQIVLPSYQAVQFKGGGLPTLTTTAVSGIGVESATSGGNVSLAGSSSITAEGICWSTSSGPTIALATKTMDGTSTGAFSSSLSSLSPNVTYYVRAYATNSTGTSYGNEVSFTTSDLTVGTSYQGGTILYILVSGDPGYSASATHGLIISPQIATGSWQPSATDLLATSTDLGTGASNTALIVTARGTSGSYAAQLATDYSYGGYSDWYLPSRDELNKLFVNRVAANFSYGGSLWSSSMSAVSAAWYQTFTTGAQSTRGTGSVYGVPFFRSF